MTAEVPAVVGYPPQGGPNWRYEPVKLRQVLEDHEVLVSMVSTGICHTDIFLSSVPDGAGAIEYPKVFGHEGAGYVEEIGQGVTNLKIGDPVLLSYDYCHTCDVCKSGRPAYCLDWGRRNVVGEPNVFQSQDGGKVGGKFFGQSSFAAKSIVQATSIVNVKDLVHSKEELKLLSPMGCGLMTGVGAVLNSAKAQPYDIILVTGIGAVGLGAIMAARMSGCKEIIAVDRVAGRLEIAKELGATQTLDTSQPNSNLVDDVQKLVNNQRITYVVETTGVPAVVLAAIRAMGKNGKLIQIGIPPPGVELKIDSFHELFNASKAIECHLLGEEAPKTLIPKMLSWWRAGDFPVEKLIKCYPASEALKAMYDMENGATIKPVLLW
jgi:Zn-dependent alcohol dehydrogenase